MNKMQPTFIDVMRHGEPEGVCPNGGTILRGSTDHVLTKKGWMQAEARIESALRENEEWDVIISSPLRRCADFSESLVSSKFKDSKDLFIKKQWHEIHYGDWDGKSTADIWNDQPELMEKMWQAPLEFCAPNGEAVIDFGQRIEQAWTDLISEFQGKRVLLVCHGGVMRLLLQQLLMMAPEAMNRFAIPYDAMSRFRVDHSLSDEGTALHWPSLIAHLGEEITEGIDKKLNKEPSNE